MELEWKKKGKELEFDCISSRFTNPAVEGLEEFKNQKWRCPQPCSQGLPSSPHLSPTPGQGKKRDPGNELVKSDFQVKTDYSLLIFVK